MEGERPREPEREVRMRGAEDERSATPARHTHTPRARLTAGSPSKGVIGRADAFQAFALFDRWSGFSGGIHRSQQAFAYIARGFLIDSTHENASVCTVCWLACPLGVIR